MVEAKCYFSRRKSLNEKWPRKNLQGTAEAVCFLKESAPVAEDGSTAGTGRSLTHTKPVPPHLSEASRADWSPHPGLAERPGHSKPVVMREV